MLIREHRRRAGMALALVAMVLLLSGCLKLDMDLTVSEDDTLSGTLIFAFDKALMQAAGQSPEDVLSGTEPLPADLEGVTQKDYQDDKYQGVQYTFEGLPLEKWNTEGTDIKIERQGEEFKVSGSMDFSGATESTGDPTMDQQMSSAFESAEIRIKLTFPGEVKDGNGEISGNSITWEPKFGETTELMATASAVPGGGNMTLFIIIGAVVLILIIVIVVVAASRKGKGAAVPSEGEVPGVPEAAAAPVAEATPAPAPPVAPEAPAAPPAPPAPEVPEAPPVSEPTDEGGDAAPQA